MADSDESGPRTDPPVAIVTGAARGIGAATACRLADDGHHVVVTDVACEAGRETAETIRDRGGDDTATFRELDVTDPNAFDAAVDAVLDDHGRLDVLVNNAGILGSTGDCGEVARADRRRVLAVDAEGVWNGCRAALPAMRAAGSGAVVNVASVAGVRGSPGLATYSMAKGGVISLTRALAGEAGPDGVRVNCVAPGVVETEMTAGLRDGDDGAGTDAESLAASHALRRIGQPDEVAEAVAFLASGKASFVTGECLVVDGGYSATLR